MGHFIARRGRPCRRALLASFPVAALVLGAPASALTLAIDLDPFTAGIQSTRTAALAEIFAIDLVLIGDGVTAFDEVIADFNYNDAGLVLASTASVVSLGLSDTAITWDVTHPTFFPPMPASPVVLTPLGLAPTIPFASGEGGFGYYTDPGTFPVVGAGVEIPVAGFAVSAAGIGTTTVAPVPGPGGAILIGSVPIPVSLVTATVTVPEPALGLLVLLGLARGFRSRSACAARREGGARVADRR